MLLFYLKYILSKRRAYYVKKKKKKISQSSHSWPLYLCLAMPRDTHGFYILFLSTAICWESSHPFYSPTLVCKFSLLFSTSISHDIYSKTASNMILNLKFEYCMCNICCDRKVKKRLVWTTSYVINQL